MKKKIGKLTKHGTYFVTNIFLTYCEKKLF